jgi:hypothetical protein
MDGANQALLLASVADRSTRSIDPAGKRRFGHSSATPDRGQQVVLAHYTFAVIDQKQEKIENLRFDSQQPPSSAQLPPMSVNGIVFENQQQLTRLQVARPPHISNLRHSRCREKSRAFQRKINAVSMQFWNAIGILHQPSPWRGSPPGAGAHPPMDLSSNEVNGGNDGDSSGS